MPVDRADTLRTQRAMVELADTLPMPRAAMELAETLPVERIQQRGASGVPRTGRASTYAPTGWALIDRLLMAIDRRTGGRAALVQRVFTYLIVGGMAALINLAFFYLFYYRVHLVGDDSTAGESARYVVAFALATEISIVANFVANDRLTFRRLPGHKRSWWVRCARFHLTCLFGTVVTLVLSYILHLFIAAILAQAISLIVVTAINFVNHHVFTYRHPTRAS
jgi:putative flippase GtrA